LNQGLKGVKRGLTLEAIEAILEVEGKLNPKTARNLRATREWEAEMSKVISLDKEFDNMKFDVVVINPPYQDGAPKSGKNLFQMFNERAVELSTEGLVTICPHKWLNSPRLSTHKEIMLNAGHIKSVTQYGKGDLFTDAQVSVSITHINRRGRKQSLTRLSLNNKPSYKSASTLVNLRDTTTTISDNEIFQTILQKVKDKANLGLSWVIGVGVHKDSTTEAQSAVYSTICLMSDNRVAFTSSPPGGVGGIALPTHIGGNKLGEGARVLRNTDAVSLSFHSIECLYPDALKQVLSADLVKLLVFSKLTNFRLSSAPLNMVPQLDLTQQWDNDKINNFFGLTKDETTYVAETIREFDAKNI